ncbi:MAG: radical SAM family heme chaperone HemW [Sphingomonadales bacterium]
MVLSANYELCLELSGLYIHIPFCRKACTYCNFHFTTGSRYREDFMQYIQMEYDLLLPEWSDPWETLYFGGGTPSLLPAEQLGKFITHIKLNGGIQPGAEITIEANPEDVNVENIEKWKLAGINRISLGVQSLSNVELQAMNRAHTAANSISTLELLVNAGLQSVNLDLIYGSQWLSDEAWKETLQWAFNCGAQHISAYALTSEPNTRMQKDIAGGKIPEIDDDKQARHFELLQEYADKNKWLHYETSNLCQTGFEAKHNSNYWENKPYLGLGPSAHSFDGKLTRRWNIADNQSYVLGVENQKLNFEEELLSDNDYINELIITRLRLTKGLNTETIGLINAGWQEQKALIILEMSEKSLILIKDNHIVLTPKGRLLSDAISRELMI